jgi:phosphoheptose isomerase
MTHAGKAIGERQLSGSVRAILQLQEQLDVLERWGARIGRVLSLGGRVLAAGNGGSAAEADHLAGELVGRFMSDRQPMSALSLGTASSTLTALVNDFGIGDMFARQVVAHGRSGDVLVVFSTSGRSQNLLEAANAAHERAMTTLAFTGSLPNPLAEMCDEAVTIQDALTPAVQEAHQVGMHLLCSFVDSSIEHHGAPVSSALPESVR